MSKFQIITLFIFGFIGLLGVLAFSGLVDNRTDTSLGKISIWGTLPKEQISNAFTQLEIDKKIDFGVDYKGYGEKEFENALINALASGKGPDAILLSDDLIQHFADKIYTVSFESIPARYIYDTYADAAEIFVTGQGVLGYPLVIDPIVAYYNKDMLATAGIVQFPKTWKEMISSIPGLAVRDTRGGITQGAVALGGYNNIDNAKDIVSSLLLQAGQKIMSWTDGGGISVYIDENASPALTFFSQFSDPTQEAYTWNSALDNSRRMFEASKLAVYFGRASEYDSIRLANPHLNFDVALMPQRGGAVRPAVYGKVYAFAVLNASANKSNAFTAGSILSSAEVLAGIAKGARLAPARRDLLGAGTTDPAMAIFYRSAIISQGWLDPDIVASEEVYRRAISGLLSGQSNSNSTASYIAGELGKLRTY